MEERHPLADEQNKSCNRGPGNRAAEAENDQDDRLQKGEGEQSNDRKGDSEENQDVDQAKNGSDDRSEKEAAKGESPRPGGRWVPVRRR
jgi:hypothetical protein